MIDYQAIVDNLSEEKVKDILTKLDIPFVDKGSYLQMPTYCHNHKDEEASHKLYYYKNNKIFMCYTNCQTMSIFKFLRNYYEAQGIEYNWYNDVYKVIVDNDKPEGIEVPQYRSVRNSYERRKEVQLPDYNPGVLGCFVKRYPPEWLAEGITESTMDKYNILYSISQNKIIIPHYSAETGQLVGIRGRALNPVEVETFGKYMPVQVQGVWYTHQLSMNLYGLWENKENIKKSGVCFLAEGEKSVLQAESFSTPNCTVAVCGSQFNKYQLNLLMKLCAPREIVICFDNEELPKSQDYFDKLWKIGDKYKQYCQFSFIYDREGLTRLKDSPFDHGEEIFRKLLERRVVVK